MIRAKIDKFLLGATLSISFAMNYLACFWNVDTYHEGDKFPSALAASLGNNLFTEVNNQYGFIPTYITVPSVAVIFAKPGIPVTSERVPPATGVFGAPSTLAVLQFCT